MPGSPEILPPRHSERPAWDEYDAYLFDIDGTLLTCTDAVHYFAFCEALTTLAGRPMNLDGVITHGNVDVGILRDALQLAGISDTAWRPKLGSMQQEMCRFVEEHTADFQITVLPAVAKMIDHLHARGAVLGLATGNLERIGQAKLRQCDLLDRFAFGGYSDLYECRRDVFRGALEQAHDLAGKDARVCVVGDTPEDIRSARANQLDVIAVATGTHAFDVLQAESPDWCLHSLEELPGI